MEIHANQVGFFRACIEARSPHKFDSFPKKDQVSAPLLNYTREHGVPIDIPRGINIIELKKALNYRAHPSVVKDKAFVRKDIDEQLRSGNIAILLLEYVKYLQGIYR